MRVQKRSREDAAKSRLDLIVACIGLMEKGYPVYRKLSGLKPIKDTGEGCMGLADKVGRLCRQLKHIVRKDPKINAKEEAEDAMAGALVYMLLLAERHELSIEDGLSRELHKSLEQHKK